MPYHVPHAVDSASHCERHTDGEIEVTPEMAEIGSSIIFQAPGVAPCGVFFSGEDLATEVYRAMEHHRRLKRDAWKRRSLVTG